MQSGVSWSTDGSRFREQKEGECRSLQAVESQSRLRDDHPQKVQSGSLQSQHNETEGGVVNKPAVCIADTLGAHAAVKQEEADTLGKHAAKHA